MISYMEYHCSGKQTWQHRNELPRRHLSEETLEPTSDRSAQFRSFSLIVDVSTKKKLNIHSGALQNA
jgi:hypothetical protein